MGGYLDRIIDLEFSIIPCEYFPQMLLILECSRMQVQFEGGNLTIIFHTNLTRIVA